MDTAVFACEDSSLAKFMQAKAEFILKRKRKMFFHRFLVCIFEVMSFYLILIDRYQNAIPRGMPLIELKKVEHQERFTLMTHNSIGHLKTLCISVLMPSGGVLQLTAQRL